MRVNPSTPGLPLSYYSNLYRFNQIPPQVLTPTRKNLDTTTVSYKTELDDFPKEFFASKLLSHLYNHFYPKLSAPSKYIIHHVGESLKKKHKDSSLMGLVSPFMCGAEESYEEDDDDGGYNDYIDSSEFLKKRKYKYYKKKKKKKKIDKKKLLFKFLLFFFLFIALKALLEKFYYIFPTIFTSTAREELADQMDMLLEEGFDQNRASDWNRAQQLGEKHRALFVPNYEETRIDVRIPIRQRISTDS